MINNQENFNKSKSNFMSKRNLIIGSIVLIALAGGIVLWNQKNSQQDTKQQAKKEVVEQTQGQKTIQEQRDNQNQTSGELKPEEKIDTSNWKTYRNERYGFSFKYPKDWKVENIKGRYPAPIYKEFPLILSPINTNNKKGLEKLHFIIGILNNEALGTPEDIFKKASENISKKIVNGKTEKLMTNGLQVYYIIRDKKEYKDAEYYIIHNKENIIMQFRVTDYNEYYLDRWLPYFREVALSVK